MLALVFGVLKFHQYLYGRKFILYTDHRPLQYIFGPTADISRTAANRLQRWAVSLSVYNYDIQYRPSHLNSSADALSRLPLATTTDASEEADIQHIRSVMFEDLPLTEKGLSRQTRNGKILQQVLQYVRHGWPEKRQLASESLIPYFNKRDELSVDTDIIIWRDRAVILESMRSLILNALHEGHPGIVEMRSLARYYVWWPGIDNDVEHFLKTCEPCQKNRPRPMEVLLFSWNVANGPWDRIHIDYAGPFEGYMWLVVVDSFTKWVEIVPLTTATSLTTITALRVMYGRWGIPRQLVSDNGAQFTSSEFKEFCEKNGVTHIRTTPYHPKTNGLAERMVQTFKQRFRASSNNKDIQVRLQNFLLSYRNTPHTSTNRSPAEMFIGRRLATVLDHIRPDVKRTLNNAALRQAAYHDQHSDHREFEIGDAVWVTNEHSKGSRTATIISRTGPLSYEVSSDGLVQRKHADQMRQRLESELPVVTMPETSQTPITDKTSQLTPASVTMTNLNEQSQNVPSKISSPTVKQTDGESNRRYPQRERRPSIRYHDE